jgi:hypothetical protein
VSTMLRAVLMDSLHLLVSGSESVGTTSLGSAPVGRCGRAWEKRSRIFRSCMACQ